MDENRKAELRATLKGMQGASDRFYREATRLNNHAFIEFTGFLNEYIKICTAALHDGIDFGMANVHAPTQMPLRTHHAVYLAEKFACVFASAFASNPDAYFRFVEDLDNEVRRTAGRLGQPERRREAAEER